MKRNSEISYEIEPFLGNQPKTINITASDYDRIYYSKGKLYMARFNVTSLKASSRPLSLYAFGRYVPLICKDKILIIENK